MHKANQRKENLIYVIDTLRNNGSLTQANLKNKCKLQASTISYLIKDLKKYNLIKEIGIENNSTLKKVGKPGVYLSLNNEEACFLGIYVEDNYIDISVFGLDSLLLESKSESIKIDNLTKQIDNIICNTKKQYKQLKNIGIAIKGIVHNDGSINSGDRYLSSGIIKKWNFVNLLNELQDRYPNNEIIMENDANCAAIYYQYKSKQFEDSFVTYVLNNNPFGIGIGLIVKGKLYKGNTGAAGEYFEKEPFFKNVSNFHKKPINYVVQILEHAKIVNYLLNPKEIIFSGSVLSSLTKDENREINLKIQETLMPITICSGEKISASAKGIALMATELYIKKIIGGVETRW